VTQRRDSDRKWQPVIVPSETFQSAMERIQYEAVVRENPRKPDETAVEWAERIKASVVKTDFGDQADWPNAEKED
jgi:hypothetical protein